MEKIATTATPAVDIKKRHFLWFVAGLITLYGLGIGFFLLSPRFSAFSSAPIDAWTLLLLILFGFISFIASQRIARQYDAADAVPEFAGAFATMGVLIANVRTGMAIAFMLSWLVFIVPYYKTRKQKMGSHFGAMLMSLYDALEYPFIAMLVGLGIYMLPMMPYPLLWVAIPLVIFVVDYLNMLLTMTGIVIRSGISWRSMRERIGIHALRQNVLYYLFILFGPVLAAYLHRSAGYVGVAVLSLVMIPVLHSGHLYMQLQESQRKRQMDTLTQIRNGLGFRASLEEIRARGNRLAIVILDLDKFKEINDKYGHAMGDKTLCQFVDKLSQLLHKYGSQCELFRLHGDEFAILVRDVSVVDALMVRLKKNRDAFSVPISDATDAESIRIRFSAGVHVAESGETLHDMVEKADREMYRQKHGGQHEKEDTTPT